LAASRRKVPEKSHGKKRGEEKVAMEELRVGRGGWGTWSNG